MQEATSASSPALSHHSYQGSSPSTSESLSKVRVAADLAPAGPAPTPAAPVEPTPSASAAAVHALLHTQLPASLDSPQAQAPAAVATEGASGAPSNLSAAAMAALPGVGSNFGALLTQLKTRQNRSMEDAARDSLEALLQSRAHSLPSQVMADNAAALPLLPGLSAFTGSNMQGGRGSNVGGGGATQRPDQLYLNDPSVNQSSSVFASTPAIPGLDTMPDMGSMYDSCSGGGAGGAGASCDSGGGVAGGSATLAAVTSPGGPMFNSASLYVKNLPPETDELWLYQKFAPHGAILSCKVQIDPTTHKCRGVAFINYLSQSDALKAMQSLHGTRIAEGRQLHISLQAPRAVRAAVAAANTSSLYGAPNPALPPTPSIPADILFPKAATAGGGGGGSGGDGSGGGSPPTHAGGSGSEGLQGLLSSPAQQSDISNAMMMSAGLGSANLSNTSAAALTAGLLGVLSSPGRTQAVVLQQALSPGNASGLVAGRSSAIVNMLLSQQQQGMGNPGLSLGGLAPSTGFMLQQGTAAQQGTGMAGFMSFDQQQPGVAGLSNELIEQLRRLRQM